jgi:electron transfer flavoprotein beta subunit
MRVLVPVKRVPDYQTKVKVKPDGSGIELDSVKWIVNPFDEIAVEEAVRLQEKGVVKQVTVVSVGPADTATQLRYALAMGADDAIHVKYDGPVDSDLASRLIAAVNKRAPFDLILMGKQSIDADAGQTPQLLAERLALPHASFASKIEIADGKATVTREVDGGLETVRVPMPCVISTDLRLNEPRYASLPGIMKAKKKPLEEIDASSLGVELGLKVGVKKMTPPAVRKAGRKVESVAALVEALQKEAKVL